MEMICSALCFFLGIKPPFSARLWGYYNLTGGPVFGGQVSTSNEISRGSVAAEGFDNKRYGFALVGRLTILALVGGYGVMPALAIFFIGGSMAETLDDLIKGIFPRTKSLVEGLTDMFSFSKHKNCLL